MTDPTKTIRSTDFDALSCRYNAISRGYLPDNHTSDILRGLERVLQYENKMSHRRVFNAIVKSNKLPIINRGTYIRTVCIDRVVETFIRKFEAAGRRVRIISLGAGSDSRAFGVLEHHENLEYVEIDFPRTTRLKHAALATDEKLSALVGMDHVKEDSQEWYDSLSEKFTGDRYSLVGMDLTENVSLETLLKSMDTTVPTLIISECMLCYTESGDADRIIKTLKDHLDTAALAIYDPIGGEGNFGNVMIENLKMRNLQMPSLLQYNTLQKYRQRLEDLGIGNVRCDNMFTIMTNWISTEEQVRISRLEMLDEMEELKLLLQHYCLVVGFWGFEWDDMGLQLRN